MKNISLIKILDSTRSKRYYCSWLDFAGNVHTGTFWTMPVET